MLSKPQNKYIRSLSHHKFREEHHAFVAEGGKIASEWLASDAEISMIVATDGWVAGHTNLIRKHEEARLCIVKAEELVALSSLKTPNEVLLVIPIPEQKPFEYSGGWVLALDNIQDPGNMGTLIRIADWFGIRQVLCSPGCVDIYNPKVVQSAMGSHLRMNVYVVELCDVLKGMEVPRYAATLGGENVHKIARSEHGVLMIGNESKGISTEVLEAATHEVTIPGKGGAESLNAAVSAGILCALLLPC
jgi:RNA methyltransferase, TrmH family